MSLQEQVLFWTQEAYIKASNTGAADFFGFCVALSGGWQHLGDWLK